MPARTKTLLALLGIALIGAGAYFYYLQHVPQIVENENTKEEVPDTTTAHGTASPPSTHTEVEFSYVMEEVVPGSELGTYPKIISHSNPETLKKINALLKEDTSNFGCLQSMTPEELERTFVQVGEVMPSDFYARTYSEQENFFGFESYGKSTVLYAKKEILSIRSSLEYSCKGPYPVNVVSYRTYDMKNGMRVSLESLFDDFERDKDKILESFERNYALQTHDKECVEYITESNYKYADFFVADEGFFISPNLPHGIQACGGDIHIPLDDIKPYLAPHSILTRLF